MTIVQGDEIELKHGIAGWGGAFPGCVLAEDDEGRLDNFRLNHDGRGGDMGLLTVAGRNSASGGRAALQEASRSLLAARP